MDPEYIVEKDGAVSLELLAVSSTLLYYYYKLYFVEVVNNRMNDIDTDKKIEDEVDGQ